MVSTIVDFRTCGYFSGTMIFLGVVLSFIGLGVLFISFIIGLMMLLTSIVIFTTHYRIEVNYKTKTVHDYLWIVGLKNGERREFNSIDYLFIKRNKVSQTMNYLSISSTIHKEVYDGYLRVSENHKIHITSKDSLEEMLEKLRPVSVKLGVPIIDYSEGHANEI